jgi:hypothetical protein
MRILSKATTGAMIAGAALLVAACGGGAANNTANAPVDNGMSVTNEPAMAPMNEPMPMDNGTAPMGNDMGTAGNSGAMANGTAGNGM